MYHRACQDWWPRAGRAWHQGAAEEVNVSQELLVFNGINGASGDYLVPPMAADTLARIIQGEGFDRTHLNELRWRYQQTQTTTFALREGLDPRKLDEAGWGVIFAANVDTNLNAALHEALSELLDHRRAQTGPLYREFTGRDGYRSGESKNDFLARHGAGPGPVDPARVPYYLLIVGDPETIPYRFQYELDVSYAVGRIHFATLEEYAQYARSVVMAETGEVRLPRRAVFFGVANPGDRATQISTENLVVPLADALRADQSDWSVESVLRDEATKARLGQLLGGDETPAFLFTASHGVGFPNGDQRQLPFQGALLCQDWPGPRQREAIARDHYLGGEDLARDARLLGTVTFHFACYGAGTPYWDDFSKLAFKERAAVAPHAFMAALPQRLLGHPNGGALAVIGHVERAWTYSFKWQRAGTQTVTYESTLKRLMEGHPVGSAVDYINLRYAEIATQLSSELEEAEYTKPDPFELANLWTAHNDARGYAIIGDPAVRLPVGGSASTSGPRPAIRAVDSRPGGVPVVLSGDIPNPPSAPDPSPDASPAPPPASSATDDDFDAVAFGWLGRDTARQLRDGLADTLNQLAARLAIWVDDVASLEVATFVSEDMETVAYDSSSGAFTGGARQRALTRITLDGDVKICVPLDADEIDEDLWAIHASMVEQAQANRTAMLKAVAEVLAGLLSASGGK